MEQAVDREELNGGGSLPHFYGENILVLLPRDPGWIFAYWEITPSTCESLRREWGEEEWDGAVRRMRLYRHRWEREGEIESFTDIELPVEASNWYLEAGYPDHFYHLELGWKKRDGSFYPLLRSNTVRTPRDRVSDIIDENWSLPDWKFRRLYRRISLYHISSPELLKEPNHKRHPGPFFTPRPRQPY